MTKFKLDGQTYQIRLEDKQEVRMASILIADAYYSTDDASKKEEAAMAFCSILKRYIWKLLVKHYPTYQAYYEDMENCAYVGILEALKYHAYDAAQSMPTTFFHPYIMAALREYADGYIRQASSYYSQAESVISRFFEKEPHQKKMSSEEISRAVGIPKRTVEVCMAISNTRNISLDYDELTLKLDSIKSVRRPSTEEVAIEEETMMNIHNAINKEADLTNEERQAVVLYYGIYDKKMSKAKISKMMHTDEHIVQQYLYRGKQKLKKKLPKEY